jgi:hypothetical protein
MSIDKLIALLDKEPRSFQTISVCGSEILEDYIGVADAYIDLLISVKNNRDQVYYICLIIEELINSIKGLNDLLRAIELNQIEQERVERLAGQILKGEQNIDNLIEKFEALDIK